MINKKQLKVILGLVLMQAGFTLFGITAYGSYMAKEYFLCIIAVFLAVVTVKLMYKGYERLLELKE